MSSGGGGGGGASDYATEVAADSPSLWYRLDETSGTTAFDEQGNVNGTFINTPTLNVTGPINKAITLNAGTSEWVDLGENDTYMESAQITIEAWVRTTATSTRQIVDRDENAGGRVFQFRMESTGVLRFIGWPGIVGVSSTGTINDGNWHHVAVVVDGTDIILYVDGAEDGSTSFSGGLTTSEAVDMAIGRYQGGAQYWSGDIAEVAFYQSALSASRIEAHAFASDSPLAP